MPGTVVVGYQQGDRFEITVRHHVLHADQPVPDGGDDSAPTPTELFVVSLASCVAFYARRFLARHELPATGLSVTAEFEMATRPTRVGDIDLTIHLPDAVPDDKRPALLAVASHCTVHNTLEQPPSVHIELGGDSTPAMSGGWQAGGDRPA